MTLELNIPETHLPEIKQVYGSKARSIANRIEELQRELEELKPILEKLGLTDLMKPKGAFAPEINFKLSADIKYDKKWKWKLKIKYILSNVMPHATTKQIIDAIMIIEPSLPYELLKNSIPATISVESIKADGMFIREKNMEEEYVYSLRNA